MSTFRGENFDYYEQLLPAEEWGKEAFVNDWLEGVKEGLGDSIPLRVEVAQKSVIEPLYDDYKECLNLIDEDLELKEDEKKLMVRELNYAMKALLDYEIRFPGDIIQTLRSNSELMDEGGFKKLHDTFIELLIHSLKQRNNEYSLKLSELSSNSEHNHSL